MPNWHLLGLAVSPVVWTRMKMDSLNSAADNSSSDLWCGADANSQDCLFLIPCLLSPLSWSPWLKEIIGKLTPNRLCQFFHWLWQHPRCGFLILSGYLPGMLLPGLCTGRHNHGLFRWTLGLIGQSPSAQHLRVGRGVCPHGRIGPSLHHPPVSCAGVPGPASPWSSSILCPEEPSPLVVPLPNHFSRLLTWALHPVLAGDVPAPQHCSTTCCRAHCGDVALLVAVITLHLLLVSQRRAGSHMITPDLAPLWTISREVTTVLQVWHCLRSTASCRRLSPNCCGCPTLVCLHIVLSKLTCFRSCNLYLSVEKWIYRSTIAGVCIVLLVLSFS